MGEELRVNTETELRSTVNGSGGGLHEAAAVVSGAPVHQDGSKQGVKASQIVHFEPGTYFLKSGVAVHEEQSTSSKVLYHLAQV